MIKHIVMWRVTEDDKKRERILLLKEALEKLPFTIPEIETLEVGIQINNRAAGSCDIILNSSFLSEAALETYQKHPEHIKVVALLRSLTYEKRVVDYQV